MTQRRTIGRLAREAGVGVETIRFYERRGLIARPARPAGGGWRHYDDAALVVLRYVRLAQSLGFTLKDIEQLISRTAEGDGAFCAAVRATAEVKLAGVRDEIAALTAQAGRLEDFLVACRARSTAGPCPVLANLQEHGHDL